VRRSQPEKQEKQEEEEEEEEEDGQVTAASVTGEIILC